MRRDSQGSGLQGARLRLCMALSAVALAGCGGGEAELPEPRPVVVFSGERLRAEPDRLEEIHDWVTEAVETIELDPSFVVYSSYVPEPSYPWETLVDAPADTVRIAYEQSAPDAGASYRIYAFLHQMREMGRLKDWFPETEFMEGFELERFIVARVADSWLLGRTTFDTHPYRPLDELIYAHEAGMLDAFLLHHRGDEFPEARDRFLEENPDGFQEFEEWYERTFGEGISGGA